MPTDNLNRKKKIRLIAAIIILLGRHIEAVNNTVDETTLQSIEKAYLSTMEIYGVHEDAWTSEQADVHSCAVSFCEANEGGELADGTALDTLVNDWNLAIKAAA